MKIMSVAIGLVLFITFQAPVVQAEEESSELERIQEAGVLHVGLNESYPPFIIEQAVADDEYIQKGLSLSVIEYVAEELGVEVEYHFELFLGDLLDQMDEGEIDVMVGPITDIGWAGLGYPLSEPYYSSRQAIVIHEEYANFFHSVESMKGQTIGVTQEAHNENLSTHFPDITIEEYEGLTEIFELVHDRELAGVVANEGPALTYSTLNEELTYFFVPDLGTYDLRVAFAKEDEEFVQTVNEILDTLSEETKEQYLQEAIEEIPKLTRAHWYIFDEQAKEEWIEERDRRLNQSKNRMIPRVENREEPVTGMARIPAWIQQNPRALIGMAIVLLVSWLYVLQRTKNK